jgi:hypothetical protein
VPGAPLISPAEGEVARLPPLFPACRLLRAAASGVRDRARRRQRRFPERATGSARWRRRARRRRISPPQEAALDPAACGACHAQQYEDWRTAWHAKAMGPGVLGQLLDMAPRRATNTRTASAATRRSPSRPTASSRPSPARLKTGLACRTRPGLRRLPCARAPPLRPAAPRRLRARSRKRSCRTTAGRRAPPFPIRASAPAATSSRPDGFALNGKLLENTYEEWQASPAAREGKACQSCHMPDRRHLWRGVHDRETVKGGVTIAASPPRVEAGAVLAGLTLRNSGTGHHFPTYVTPRVVAEIFQAGADGKAAGRHAAGARHRAAGDARPLARESPTRAWPPTRKPGWTTAGRSHPRAGRLDYRVRVEPDAFYTAFYRSLLPAAPARARR